MMIVRAVYLWKGLPCVVVSSPSQFVFKQGIPGQKQSRADNFSGDGRGPSESMTANLRKQIIDI